MADALAPAFLIAAGMSPGSAPPGLERRIEEGVRRAQARWPGIRGEAAAFARYWGERAGGKVPDEATDFSRVEELYLAFACAQRDRAAIAAFEASYMSQVHLFVARLRIPPDQFEDYLQQLREALLVGRDGQSPKISRYEGRGPLGGWLRVVAVRTGLNSLRGRRPDQLVTEPGARAVDDEPERRLFRERYAPALKVAVEDALAALPRKERQILRLHFLEHLAPEVLAKMFHVHRTTVLRWIQRAYDEVLTGARTHLRKQLTLSDSELDSLIGLAQSQLALTLSRVLAESGGSGDE